MTDKRPTMHSFRRYLILGAIALVGAAVVLFAITRPPKVHRTQNSVRIPDVSSSLIDTSIGTKPEIAEHSGYVSSKNCIECHQDKHSSWHQSYHRTMTQFASPEAVVAPFDVELTAHGFTSRLERRGDEFWVEMIDPIWESEQRASGKDPYAQENPPRKWAKVVMTTGSHHRQSYWVETGSVERGNEVLQFPWTYQIDEKRWLPLDDAFLQPGDQRNRYFSWNENCIGCHSLAGIPGIESGYQQVSTVAAELGISCESCHGPGEDHVEFYRSNPDKKNGGPKLANPKLVSNVQATHICATCHSFSGDHSARDWLAHGTKMRPGDDLEEMRYVFRLDDLPEEASLRGGFWNDGTARTGGREYNAMSLSACYKEGSLSCISCHSMHEFQDPDHQLGQRMDTNHACLQCHESIAEDVSAHTHHSADSSGSRCYNCHMPFTSYALLTVTRSHRIDIPSVESEVKFGRPNACNLCHLDKTLAWTNRHLAEWHGTEEIPLTDDQSSVAASVRWLLQGDAAQRVVVAGNFGLAHARSTSGENWMAPHLANLFDDSYSAVRWLAYESLRKQPAFRDFSYDFVGDSQHRAKAKESALQVWQGLGKSKTGEEILIGSDGIYDNELAERLRQKRDDRRIRITE